MKIVFSKELSSRKASITMLGQCDTQRGSSHRAQENRKQGSWNMGRMEGVTWVNLRTIW